MTNTTRLSMPFLQAAQAQKHVTVNESLRALDVLVQAGVEDTAQTTPPVSPVEGQAYIIAASASGDWAGKENQIAAYQDGAWAYHAPSEGWRVYDKSVNNLLLFDGADWVVFSGGGGLDLTALQDGTLLHLGVNTASDTANRLSVKTDAGFFSHDDVSGSGSGDVRIDYNKKAAPNTAAFLFKTNWTAHAEIGLAGDNKLRAKVTPDGSVWYTAWEVDENTGAVSFPNTTLQGGFLPAYTDIDTSEPAYTYRGWADYNGAGDWLITRQSTTAPYDTQNATSGAADYATAWADRTTLTYS